MIASLAISVLTTSASDDFQENLEASIDNYAGAWIDENNVPHVAFTGKPDHDVMQMTRNEGVVVEYGYKCITFG